MHCGKAHPDLLLAELTYRQMREIETYAGVEPIGPEMGVSRPSKERDTDGPKAEDVEDKLDRILGQFEGE